METITGTIEKIEIKEGEKKFGGKWTRYDLYIDGKRYGLFDKPDFKKGDSVTLTLEKNGKFENVTRIENAIEKVNEAKQDQEDKNTIKELLETNNELLEQILDALVDKNDTQNA